MNAWLRFLIVVGVLSALPAPAVLAAECLKYEVVSLSGTLVRQTYAGPPDFESMTKGDAPQIIWILQLDARLCVIDSNSTDPRVYNEREVQLVSSAAQDLRYRELLGQRVIATGKLRHGGARDDKRLVLEAGELKRTGVLP